MQKCRRRWILMIDYIYKKLSIECLALKVDYFAECFASYLRSYLLSY